MALQMALQLSRTEALQMASPNVPYCFAHFWLAPGHARIRLTQK